MSEPYKFKYNNILNFKDIEKEITHFFETKYKIKIDEHSNVNYLIDFFSIINMYMNYQIGNVAKENFLLSATNSKAILEVAQNKLGYIPNRKRPSTIKFKIEFPKNQMITTGFEPNNPTNDELVIKGNDTGYLFYAKDIVFNRFFKNNEYVYIADIEATQYTEKIFETIGIDQPFQTITLGHNNLSNDEIIVKVDNEQWTLFTNWNNEPLPDSKIYWIKENPLTRELEISFGNGFIGKQPDNIEDIKILYKVTDGSLANGETSLSIKNNDVFCGVKVKDLSNFTITNIKPSYGGRDKETINEIKQNAPKFHSAKNRLVTLNDYSSMLETNRYGIKFYKINDNISNEINTQTLGNVQLSIVPDTLYKLDIYNNYLNNTSSLPIENIDELNYSGGSFLINEFKDVAILATEHIINSPGYLLSTIQPIIETDDVSDINIVYTRLFNYVNNNFEGFGKDFRVDELTNDIMENVKIKSINFNIKNSFLFDFDLLKTNKKFNFDQNLIEKNTEIIKYSNIYDYKIDNFLPYDMRSFYMQLTSKNDFNRSIVNDNLLNNKQICTKLFFDKISETQYSINSEQINNMLTIKGNFININVINNTNKMFNFGILNYFDNDTLESLSKNIYGKPRTILVEYIKTIENEIRLPSPGRTVNGYLLYIDNFKYKKGDFIVYNSNKLEIIDMYYENFETILKITNPNNTNFSFGDSIITEENTNIQIIDNLTNNNLYDFTYNVPLLNENTKFSYEIIDYVKLSLNSNDDFHYVEVNKKVNPNKTFTNNMWHVYLEINKVNYLMGHILNVDVFDDGSEFKLIYTKNSDTNAKEKINYILDEYYINKDKGVQADLTNLVNSNKGDINIDLSLFNNLPIDSGTEFLKVKSYKTIVEFDSMGTPISTNPLFKVSHIKGKPDFYSVEYIYNNNNYPFLYIKNKQIEINTYFDKNIFKLLPGFDTTRTDLFKIKNNKLNVYENIHNNNIGEIDRITSTFIFYKDIHNIYLSKKESFEQYIENNNLMNGIHAANIKAKYLNNNKELKIIKDFNNIKNTCLLFNIKKPKIK